jgi:DNA-binding NtrC family response regulator
MRASPATRRPDVLLVDDEPSITEFLRRVFVEFDVREAGGVCAALQAIERRVPDAVVTDLGMDDGGGRYLLAILADRFPTVLRIVYSAAPAAELIGLTESGLANTAVQKSGDWSALRRALGRLEDRAQAVGPPRHPLAVVR